MSEPVELFAGEAMGARFDPRLGFIQGEFTGEEANGFRVSDSLSGGAAEGGMKGEETLGFCDEAVLEHRFDSAVDAVVEVFTRPAQGDDASMGGGRVELGLKGADGLSALFEDLEGADEAAEVVGVDAGGGGGIAFGEEVVEVGGGALAGEFSEAAAEVPVGLRAIEETFGDGFEVEGGASDEERDAVSGADIVDGRPGETSIEADAGMLVGVEDVDEVMGDEGALPGGRFGGGNIHTAVDSHGVKGYDLSMEMLREGDGDGGFADGGRSDEKKGGSFRQEGSPECRQ